MTRVRAPPTRRNARSWSSAQVRVLEWKVRRRTPVAYRRVSRLLDQRAQARADGTYLTALRRLAKVQVLVMDDFGLEPLGAAERKVLLEVLEDRYGLAATIITSQLDPKDWHPVIGDETVADAICDRLVHGAHRIKLTGESMRKGLTNGTKPAK